MDKKKRLVLSMSEQERRDIKAFCAARGMMPSECLLKCFNEWTEFEELRKLWLKLEDMVHDAYSLLNNVEVIHKRGDEVLGFTDSYCNFFDNDLLLFVAKYRMGKLTDEATGKEFKKMAEDLENEKD